jgi:hypothetical protein
MRNQAAMSANARPAAAARGFGAGWLQRSAPTLPRLGTRSGFSASLGAAGGGPRQTHASDKESFHDLDS